jgi:hypothetical protein
MFNFEEFALALEPGQEFRQRMRMGNERDTAE